MIRIWIGLALAVLWPAALGWAHGGGDSVHLQCEQPRGETLRITVQGGREFASPGEIFGLDVEQLTLKRCQPVEVTFINTDDVRHAFMIDGLSPMFMIELAAKGQSTASFVAPDEDATLLLHCHVPGHDRAGMNGVVVVGAGDQTTGITPQTTAPWADSAWIVLGLLGGFVAGGVGAWTWSSLR